MRRALIIAILLGTSLVAGAQTRAIVDFSVATLHREASYTSPVESQCLMGSLVFITDSNSYWRRVIAMDPSYSGWAEELSLVEMNPDEFAAYRLAPKYICTAESSHIYTEPSASSQYFGEITLGGVIRKVLADGGKPVVKKHFAKVLTPAGKEGWIPEKCLADYSSWKNGTKADADAIIATAKLMLGSPYIWGGNSTKGADCSGLTWLAFYMNGIELPRDASKQALQGTEVALEDALPGDLIFFGNGSVSHVAIYLGSGKILHASQVVRISSLDPSAPDWYDHKPILHVRRIL